MRMESILNIK